MSNQDFDYPMMVRGARGNMSLIGDYDPDQASRAYELESATGAPSSYILRDIKDFEHRHKLSLSQDIVRSNPYLMDYVNSHPLAPVVSQNDWSNLDNLSSAYKEAAEGTVHPWWQRYPYAIARGAGGGTADVVASLGRIIGSEGLTAKAKQIKTAVQEDFPLTPQEQTYIMSQILTGVGQLAPMIAGGVAGAALAPEAAVALPFGLAIGAGVGGAALVGGLQHAEEQAEQAEARHSPTTGPFIGGLATGAALNLLPLGIVTRPWEKVAPGMINWGAAALKRAVASGGAQAAVGEMQSAIDAEMARWTYNPDERYSLDSSRMLVNMLMGMTMGIGHDAIKAFIDGNQHIPPGTHPLIDKILFEHTKVTQKAFDEVLKRAADTDTPDHGPGSEELFKKFLEIHPEAVVGLDGNAILQLYGDKPPAPDDKLFGFLPDIDAQLARIRQSGGDLHVPMSDYVHQVRMNPELDKALHDSRKLGLNGLSLDDVKQHEEAAQAEEEQHQKLLETPDLPRYVGGLHDTNVPVVDAINNAATLNRILPVPPEFWEEKGAGKGIVNRNDIGIRNRGATVKLLFGFGQRRVNGDMVDVKTLGQTTGREILQGIDLNSFDKLPTPTRELMTFFRDKGAELAGDVPVFLVSAREIKEKVHGGQRGAPAGYYDPQTHHIVLNTDSLESRSDAWITHVVVHEMAHAVTSRIIYQDPTLRVKLIALKDEAMDWLIKNEPDSYDPNATGGYSGPTGKFHNTWLDYAFLNEHEFLAQSWSQPEVMEVMSRAQISNDMRDHLNLPAKTNSVWDNIKAIVKQAMEKVFGKIPDTIMDGVLRWSEMVEGEIKGQKIIPPLPPDTPIEPPMPEPPDLFKDQTVLGYTKEHWERVKKKLLEAREKTAEWRKEQAQKDAERQVTEWWKQAEQEMQPDARQEVYNQPVIAAHRFLHFGQLGNDKLTRRRLNGEFLTEDQKSQLDPQYWQKGRGGLNPDEVAPLFGYRSGEALVSDLIGLSIDMKNANMTPVAYVGKLVRDKLQWMMEEKYGRLSDNIAEQAQDFVVNEGNFDLLHEDMLRIASLAGLKAPMSKEQVKNAAIDELENTRRGSVSSTLLTDLAGRQGRQVEAASTSGDHVLAFELAQKRQINFYKAMEMREKEKTEAKGMKVARGHVKRELDTFRSEDAAPFHDFIQAFLNKFGLRVNRKLDELIPLTQTRGYDNFRAFVEKMEHDYAITIAAPDFLRDVDFTSPKKIKDLTVGEAQSLWETLTSLDKEGRAIRRINLQGDQYSLDTLLENAYERLERFSKVDRPTTRGVMSKALGLLKTYDAASRIVERLLDRFDGGNPRGIFAQVISRPMTQAANHEVALDREHGGRLRKLGEPKDFTKIIDPPPMIKHWNGDPLTSFTNSNKLAIALNMGNDNNWWKFTSGRGLDETGTQALHNWMMTNMSKEEWEWVQGVWDIFKDLKKQLDTVYLKTVHFPPGRVPIRPLETPHGVFEGGYYPLIAENMDFGPGSRTGVESVGKGPGHFTLNIPNPHARQRTGALYPITMSLDHLPDRFYQIIHDIAFKEALMDAKKFLGDPGLLNRIDTHYGKEYRETVTAWLNRIAHVSTFNSAAAKEGQRVSEFLRQNMMSFFVGFNISTVLKHGPTALISSARRIGVDNLLRGYANMYRTNDETGKYYNDLVNSSEEIQRRGRDWAERFGGVYKDFSQSTLRESIIEWGSKPVALSDMLSAKPMWLGAYLKSREEGMDHGQAMFEADREVRFAHGSTAPTNLPEIATGGGIHAWMTSLYHFFGTMLQNRMEIGFKLNDMYKMGRQGELKRAAAILPLLAADVFAYVVWPTAVEEYVTGLGREDRRGLGHRLAWASVGGLANSAIYARDIVHSLEFGVNQEGGLLDSIGEPLSKTFRDVAKAVDGKERIYNAKFAGNLIQDLINLTTYAYGTPKEVGNLAKYGWNVATGVEHPRTGIMKDWYQWGDVGRGLTHGEQKMAKVK